jgi:DNA-directed RNA polymerase specialized sigma24 family protein
VLQLAKWEIARALSDARKADPKLESVSEFARERSRSRGSVTRADDVRRLEALLARMRPTYAAVLRCRLMEEKSAEETAVELGLTLENVKKRLLRARAELERLSARWARSERGESEGE